MKPNVKKTLLMEDDVGDRTMTMAYGLSVSKLGNIKLYIFIDHVDKV